MAVFMIMKWIRISLNLKKEQFISAYIRLHLGQGYWINDYFPEALGPPSNVISFVWDEVVGNR